MLSLKIGRSGRSFGVLVNSQPTAGKKRMQAHIRPTCPSTVLFCKELASGICLNDKAGMEGAGFERSLCGIGDLRDDEGAC